MSDSLLNHNEKRFAFILFSILPIAIIAGSAILNLIISFIDLYFLFIIIKKKNTKILLDKILILFLFLWILLILNSILIANTPDSIIRTSGFIRFILLIFAFKFFYGEDPIYFKKFVLGFWFIIFLIVTVDIFFEFFMGFNLLGFESDYNGRIASFTGNELKIGNYYFGFILFSLSYVYISLNKYSKSYFYLFALIFLITSFIIGERSNFLKVLIILTTFIFLINNKNYFKKILTIFIFLIISSIIIFSNNFFKSRFIVEILDPIREKGINKFVKETKHGQHFEIAKNIYEKNKIFGVGIKNFRNESKKIEYHSDRTLEQGVTSHPHQIHYEFLSETGLAGYLIFILFFVVSIYIGLKKFLKNKTNIFALSSSLFLMATFLPILPSGSFFTSYSASIFWINYMFLLKRED
ncbi:O-antigen ligase family protein [Candidatus Pelagibacter sp.]|uniref:O-antigen ligase family protein n=1 Tax=Candidatus Pelagibacter sp. TaxID=2024849 RepID=UPI003F87F3D6